MDKNTETLKQTTEKHGNQNISMNKITAKKGEKSRKTEKMPKIDTQVTLGDASTTILKIILTTTLTTILTTISLGRPAGKAPGPLWGGARAPS